MRRTTPILTRAVAAAFFLFALSWPAYGQGLAQVQLAAEPRVEFGTDHALYRVTGGVIGPDGSIALADAGNRRILLFSSRGNLLRSIGRAGSGPGEFQGIALIAVFGDTLSVFDPVLRRVQTLLLNGSVIESILLPEYRGFPTTPQALLSPRRFLLTTVEPPTGTPGGLSTDSASVLLFDTPVRSLRLRSRVALGYNYVWRDLQGHTVYPAPFFGRARFAALGEDYAFVPFDGASVEFLGLSGPERQRVGLPIPNRRFSRDLITTYRDSLLELAKADARYPVAVVVNRIRQVFDHIPMPQVAPRVRHVLRMGSEIWVERFPSASEERVRWYIIDPRKGEVSGYIDLARTFTLLGGNDRSIIVVKKDTFDIETVQIFDVLR